MPRSSRLWWDTFLLRQPIRCTNRTESARLELEALEDRALPSGSPWSLTNLALTGGQESAEYRQILPDTSNHSGSGQSGGVTISSNSGRGGPSGGAEIETYTSETYNAVPSQGTTSSAGPQATAYPYLQQGSGRYDYSSFGGLYQAQSLPYASAALVNNTASLVSGLVNDARNYVIDQAQYTSFAVAQFTTAQQTFVPTVTDAANVSNVSIDAGHIPTGLAHDPIFDETAEAVQIVFREGQAVTLPSRQELTTPVAETTAPRNAPLTPLVTLESDVRPTNVPTDAPADASGRPIQPLHPDVHPPVLLPNVGPADRLDNAPPADETPAPDPIAVPPMSRRDVAVPLAAVALGGLWYLSPVGADAARTAATRLRNGLDVVPARGNRRNRSATWSRFRCPCRS